MVFCDKHVRLAVVNSKFKLIQLTCSGCLVHIVSELGWRLERNLNKEMLLIPSGALIALTTIKAIK